ncbi:hypothetical protein V501_04531 [Pseudogymnoascus sp. VKM F-4519 (FW-2642)]|nr:hypothetical protein V501_04531 [Pseudogymnoascus sp. VKM F-4519 (FW-2642)]
MYVGRHTDTDLRKYPLVKVSIVIGGVVRPKKLKTGDEVPWYSDPSSLHPANQQLKRRLLSKSTTPATNPSPPSLLTGIGEWRYLSSFYWLRVTGQEWSAPSMQASYHTRLAASLPPDTSTLDPSPVAGHTRPRDAQAPPKDAMKVLLGASAQADRQP